MTGAAFGAPGHLFHVHPPTPSYRLTVFEEHLNSLQRRRKRFFKRTCLAACCTRLKRTITFIASLCNGLLKPEPARIWTTKLKVNKERGSFEAFPFLSVKLLCKDPVCRHKIDYDDKAYVHVQQRVNWTVKRHIPQGS